MTLCAVVFTPEAMVACEAAGHRWATVRAWGGTCWRECTRCGQTGPTLTVVAENDAMAVAMPACDVSEPPSLPLCERPVTARRGRPSVDASAPAARRAPAAPRREWASCAARNAEIRTRAAEGETFAALGREFGLSWNRVQQIVGGTSSAPKVRNADRDEQIRRRVAAGERVRDIAAEFGIRPNRVSQILGPAVAEARHARDAAIRERYARGETSAELAGAFGMHRTHIAAIVKAGKTAGTEER